MIARKQLEKMKLKDDDITYRYQLETTLEALKQVDVTIIEKKKEKNKQLKLTLDEQVKRLQHNKKYLDTELNQVEISVNKVSNRSYFS